MSPHSHAAATRPAAQAGRFYPLSPLPLGEMVEHFLADAPVGALPNPKAVIAPHAGYRYSGPVAGSAFAAWTSHASSIQRVVLLGPSHYVNFQGVALPDASAFATPLGTVPLDPGAVEALLELPDLQVLDEAHRREHAIEVELPFLQRVLPDFTIVPLIAGRTSDHAVRAIVDRLWGGAETRFVLSSDLSHYLPCQEARQLDRSTADAIENLQPQPLTPSRACGYRVLRGFLAAAAHRGLIAETVDLRNSGDTDGPRDCVVGYGAFHFGPGSTEIAGRR